MKMLKNVKSQTMLEEANSKREQIILQLEQKKTERQKLEQSLLTILAIEKELQAQERTDWGDQEEYYRVKDTRLVLHLKIREVKAKEKFQTEELKRAEVLILKRKQVLNNVFSSGNWLSKILPEECIAELSILQSRLIAKKQETLIIQFRITKEIIGLIWAFYVHIKIENFWLFIRRYFDIF
jgi:hypothetical protein